MLQLDRLNLKPNLEGSVLSGETNFSGDNLDDLIGEISISDGRYTPPILQLISTQYILVPKIRGLKTPKSPFRICRC